MPRMSHNETEDPKDRPDTPDQPPEGEPRAFAVDLSQGLEQAFDKVRERAQHYLKRGQHTQVRLKLRGKEIATIPLTALLAAEAATFWFTGPLRLLLLNALGRTFLDVEFINEADEVVAQGKKRLLEGELEEALTKFREAIAMDGEHAPAHLNLGVALKLKGERADASTAFERAARLDPDGDTGREARRQIELLKSRAP